ncbi:23S rRNA pseudouridine2604 synthase [Lachnospiraceae bacterium XBB1006]|nr:23S rRNA pseudouridine2604 synthase [Lachnospiraceae bacterium XBB1006]
MDEIRINKFLSEAGVCSRREADRKIEAGQVFIDGVMAQTGSKVRIGQEVYVNGVRVEWGKDPSVLIAFHKPAGIVCTAEKREKNNVIDYLNYPYRIYPIGRLDKDSTGLLLLTNQGDLVNKMMRSGNAHEKEYLVTVNKPVTNEFLDGLRGGVPILGTVTRKCEVEKIDKRRFRMVLTQGLNRQIRRMCDYFGYHVVALKRVRVMNITLGDLKEGTYRDVTEKEYQELLTMIADSSNEPVRYKGDLE